jgi:hypothetical protein
MTIHKKPATVQRPHPGYVYEIAEFDDNAKYLIGWSGYRTSQNKSGLGYVETAAELAHMEGLMLRWLITGKFISHNPIYLFMMFIFALFIGILPLVFIVAQIFNSEDLRVIPFLTPLFSPYVIVGILMIINVGISIFNPRAKSITGG